MKNKRSFVLIVLLLGMFLAACSSVGEVSEETAEEPSATAASAEMLDESASVVMTLSDHTGVVQGVAYSPDGSQLATASIDGTVKIWEVASGELQHTLPYEGIEFVGNTLKFDDAGNQVALLAVGDNSAAVNFHIWDTNSGELLSQQAFAIPVENFRFEINPDWQWLVAGRKNGTPELWDIEAGEQLLTLPSHGTGVSGVSFTADGSRLMTADFEGYVQIWDMAEVSPDVEAQFAHTFTAPNGRALFRAFLSGDGSRLALGWGPVVEIWNLSDTSQPQFTLEGHTNAINYVAFSTDGTKVATASDDNTAKVWDLTSGEELFDFSGHEDAVARLTFSLDGRYLATASNDGTARIWDTAP